MPDYSVKHKDNSDYPQFPGQTIAQYWQAKDKAAEAAAAAASKSQAPESWEGGRRKRYKTNRRRGKTNRRRVKTNRRRRKH